MKILRSIRHFANMIFVRVNGLFTNIKFKVLQILFYKSINKNNQQIIIHKILKSESLLSIFIHHIAIGYIKYLIYKYFNYRIRNMLQYNYCLPQIMIINDKIIVENQFKNCITLNYISLPNVDYIKSCAFKNCYSLTHIKISKNVKYIEQNAFLNCISLKVVEFI